MLTRAQGALLPGLRRAVCGGELVNRGGVGLARALQHEVLDHLHRLAQVLDAEPHIVLCHVRTCRMIQQSLDGVARQAALKVIVHDAGERPAKIVAAKGYAALLA